MCDRTLNSRDKQVCTDITVSTYLFGGAHNQLELAFQRSVQQQGERIERHSSLMTDAAARFFQVAFFPADEPVPAFDCKHTKNTLLWKRQVTM